MSLFESETCIDYQQLLSNISLRVEDPVRELLLMQSVIGHAQNRHGRFSRAYPNATLDDIVLALGKDPIKIRRERQKVIDSIVEFAVRIIEGKSCSAYVDNNGSPLLSLTVGLELKDPAAVLKGMYLAGVMDNFEWRMKAASKYHFEIGGGECVAVDLDKLRLFGTLQDLANKEWSEKWMDEFKGSGVVIDSKVAAETNKVVSAYVRHKKGKGTSDDLAIVLAGKIYGKDAAVGVFLGDAIDTWDKYAEILIPGGQDEHLGMLIKQHEETIRRSYPGFELPSVKDVMKFIYTIAMYKGPHAVSNSQRYMLQVTRRLNQSAIESHLNYVDGKPYKEMHFSHLGQELTNTKLYRLFERRFSKNYQCR